MPQLTKEAKQRQGTRTDLHPTSAKTLAEVDSGRSTGHATAIVGGVSHELRELGTPTHIGENGQGLVLKLAINISLAVQMLAFAEGLVLAERSGIDRKLAVDVMTGSPIGSPMLKARADLVLDLPEEAWFDVSLMQKDVALALDTGLKLHIPLPSAATADQLFTLARALGYERRDIAALFQVLELLTTDPVGSPA
jgi:3-hydroxyisobutyrate dehydrogenase-like beta-hydroxyacid dehydrogenase